MSIKRPAKTHWPSLFAHDFVSLLAVAKAFKPKILFAPTSDIYDKLDGSDEVTFIKRPGGSSDGTNYYLTKDGTRIYCACPSCDNKDITE